jgi:hypothetical protein
MKLSKSMPTVQIPSLDDEVGVLARRGQNDVGSLYTVEAALPSSANHIVWELPCDVENLASI